MPSDLREPVQIGAAGLNLRDSPLEVGITGLTDTLNWRLDERGALVKTLGLTNSGFAVVSGQILEMTAYNPSSASSSTLVVYTSQGKVIKCDPTTPTNIVTGLSTSAVPSWAQMLDNLYWSNGTDALYQWDGSTATAITGVNDVQTLTTTGSPASGTFNLTYTPSGATTTNLAFNETAANVQSALRVILGSGNVNATGGPLPSAITITFVGSLGNTNQPVFTITNNLNTGTPVLVHTTPGRGDAPKGKYLTVWRNRLWVSGVAAAPNRIFWSGIGDPTAWNPLNFVDILGPRGDAVTSIHASPNIGTDASGADGVLVFKSRSTHRIIDDTDNSAGAITGGSNVMVDRGTGAVSHRTVTTINGRIYCLALDGIYSTDGHNTLILETGQLGQLISTITSRSNASQVIGVGYRGQYMLAFPQTAGQPNTRILELYTTLGGAGTHPVMALGLGNPQAWTIYTDASVGEELLAADQSSSTSYIIFRGGSANPLVSTPLTATASTGVSMFGSDSVKRLRRIRAVGRGQMIIGVTTDFMTGTGDQQQFLVDVATSPSLWNNVNWNQFTWAGQGDSGLTPISRYYSTRGRWFGFTLSESSTSVSQSAAFGSSFITGGAVLQQMQCTVTPLTGEV